MSKRKSNSYNLIITAHPDDETLFFGLLVLSMQRTNWKVICVTDGNADGQGEVRKKQFEKACKALGIKENEWLSFPDVYEKRLDVSALIEHLKGLPPPEEIFTHGILGEYGHPHHQDVSFAVHQAFTHHPHLYSVAWNCFPDRVVQGKSADYKKKAKILMDIYGTETRRFFNFLPATAVETFVKISTDEVTALYEFFNSQKKLDLSRLHHYLWLASHLEEHGAEFKPRPF